MNVDFEIVVGWVADNFLVAVDNGGKEVDDQDYT